MTNPLSPLPPNTPPRQIARAVPHTTPEAVRNLMDRLRAPGAEDSVFFCSPDRDGKREVRRGIDALRGMGPSPQAKGKAHEISCLLDNELAPGQDPRSPDFHRKAECKLREEGDLSQTGGAVARVVAAILGSPPRVLPAKHLEGEEAGGGHFFESLRGDPLAMSPTGVAYGTVAAGKKKTKMSSVFPRGVDLAQIVAMMRHPKTRTIFRFENRCLKHVEGVPYILECYIRGVQYSSIFPVFFFGEFTPGQVYHLTTDVAAPSDEVLAAAIALIRAKPGENSFQYFDPAGSWVIVDLAETFVERTQVDRGILFWFSRASSPTLFAEIPDDFFDPTTA